MANETVTDGNNDFLAGQDASKTPDIIAKNAYASGINVSTKNGALSPRWGNEKLELVFPEGGITGADGRLRLWKTLFESGKFQAMIPYTIGVNHYLIIIINGIIFFVNTESLGVQIIPLEGEGLDFGAERLNWSQAGHFVVIFDFPNYPVIIDEATARRADPAKQEVPASRMGVYNSNRLFVTNNGNEFTGGDPVGSPAAPDAPITFKEVLTIGSPYLGQIFELDNNRITGMSFLQVADTSTGIGPMLIGTKQTVHSYLVNQPRAQWQLGQFEGLFLFSVGFAGPRSMMGVGSDLFFMSGDGQIRSAAMSRDEQKRFSKVPLSREVENWIKFWDLELSRFSVLTYYQNKVIVAANPFRTDAYDNNGKRVGDYAHAGAAVLELDNITSFGESGKPAWAGLWTGIRPMEYALSNQMLFSISKDIAGVNRLYKIRPDLTYDILDNRIQQIQCRAYTRAYDFESPLNNKELNSLDMSVTDVTGDLEIKVDYKPEHGNKFVLWNTFNHKVVSQACDPTKAFPNGFASQSFRELNLGSPVSDECDRVTKDLYNSFRKVQFKIDISAKNWQLTSFAARARMEAQPFNNIACSNQYDPTNEPAQCNDDWNIEAGSLCLQ